MKDVTVIIPTYNRAHLLEETIPSYIQDKVKELIIVDDGSTDATSEIIKKLQIKFPQIITYIRLPINKGQTHAKNTGIQNCKSEWIYFGDDDSVITDDTIEILYKTAFEKNADIVGARAFYMNPGEEKLPLKEIIRNHKKIIYDPSKIIDIKNFTADFGLHYKNAVEVPFCHACFLCKSAQAKQVLFDVNYKGNGFREETDFIIRCNKAGAKIFFNSNAIQINLPITLASGGARKYKHNRTVYFFWIKNNWLFLNKHWDFIKKKYKVKRSKYRLQFKFIWDLLYPFILRRIRIKLNTF